MESLRHKAMQLAYQYRRPAVIVLDMLVGLRILLAPHEDYLASEPQRYHAIERVNGNGEVESLLGQ